VDPEGDVRSLPQQPDDPLRRGTGHHQAAGTGDPRFDRADHAGIDGVMHPEVVAADDQHPGIERETQQPTRPG
jgi:hypothetical protein